MKICPACSTQYADDANFCPMDANRLVPAPDAPATPGGGSARIANRFVVADRVASTATGDVHRATDTQTGEMVRLKFIDDKAVPTAMLADRALREWKQLGKVKSERIARVIDQGRTDDGRVYVVTEPLDGPSLEQVVEQEGALSFERARHIVAAVGEALTEAQKVGVVHRDVAPRNIVLLGDKAKLTEFGVAEPVSDRVFGTPAFLSPEQAEGKAVDQRSNIYSLGALLYYTLTGAAPFDGNTDELLQQHLNSQPKAPSARRQGLTPEVDKLVLKALEKSGGRRHLTLRQLLNEIEALQAPGALAPVAGRGLPVAERPTVVGMPVAAQEPVAAAPEMPVVAAAAPMLETPHAQPTPAAQPAVTIAEAAPPPMVTHAPPPVVEEASRPRAATPPQVARVAPPMTGLTPQPPVAAPELAASGPGPTTPMATAPPMDEEPIPLTSIKRAEPTAPPVEAAKPAPAPPVAAKETPKPARPAQQPQTAAGAKSGPAKRGFRETAWFKKGEMEEEAAQEVNPDDPMAAAPAAPGVEEMAVTGEDEQRLSLKTGRTEAMPAVRPQALPGEKMTDEDILAEVDTSRKPLVIAGVAVAIVAIAAALYFFVLRGTSETPAPAPGGAVTAPANPAK